MIKVRSYPVFAFVSKQVPWKVASHKWPGTEPIVTMQIALNVEKYLMQTLYTQTLGVNEP